MADGLAMGYSCFGRVSDGDIFFPQRRKTHYNGFFWVSRLVTGLDEKKLSKWDISDINGISDLYPNGI